MARRRNDGDETWQRLLSWSKGQKSSERLSGLLLQADNYKSIDPSHPLGGKDGLKDIICTKDGKRFVCGCYFPRNQKPIKDITKKFSSDLAGVAAHNADGFIFITNQEIKVKEREALAALNKGKITEIYHVERITNLLNSPICYGMRLEFLDIELSKEEQLSYFAARDRNLDNVQALMKKLEDFIENRSGGDTIQFSELQEFQSVLSDIVGSPNFFAYAGSAPIDKLRVPLNDIKEFYEVLERIVGVDMGRFIAAGTPPIHKLSVPLKDLEKFYELLVKIVGNEHYHVGSSHTLTHILHGPVISKLAVPIEQLREYEETLDRIIVKQNQLKLPE